MACERDEACVRGLCECRARAGERGISGHSSVQRRGQHHFNSLHNPVFTPHLIHLNQFTNLSFTTTCPLPFHSTTSVPFPARIQPSARVRMATPAAAALFNAALPKPNSNAQPSSSNHPLPPNPTRRGRGGRAQGRPGRRDEDVGMSDASDAQSGAQRRRGRTQGGNASNPMGHRVSTLKEGSACSARAHLDSD